MFRFQMVLFRYFFNVFIWTCIPRFFFIALIPCGCSSSFFPSQIFVCNLFFTALEGNKRYFDRAPTLKFSAVSSGYLKARRKIKINKEISSVAFAPAIFSAFRTLPSSYSVDLLLLWKYVHIQCAFDIFAVLQFMFRTTVHRIRQYRSGKIANFSFRCKKKRVFRRRVNSVLHTCISRCLAAACCIASTIRWEIWAGNIPYRKYVRFQFPIFPYRAF